MKNHTTHVHPVTAAIQHLIQKLIQPAGNHTHKFYRRKDKRRSRWFEMMR